MQKDIDNNVYSVRVVRQVFHGQKRHQKAPVTQSKSRFRAVVDSFTHCLQA